MTHPTRTPPGPVAAAPGTRPPLTFEVRAHSPGNGVASVHAATSDIVIDAGWGRAATGDPGPADLLASAFAACLLKNLARTRNLLGFEYQDATVDVVVRRQDSPPRFTEISYNLVVTSREPPRRIDLVHQNLRKFGTVYNTLAAVCDVRGELVTRPSGH